VLAGGVTTLGIPLAAVGYYAATDGAPRSPGGLSVRREYGGTE
jgi:hypothetical protein